MTQLSEKEHNAQMADMASFDAQTLNADFEATVN